MKEKKRRNGMRRVIMVLFLSLVCLVGTRIFAQPKSGSSIGKPLTPADFLPHKLKGGNASEAWTYVIHTPDPYIMYIQFLNSNIGVFSGTCGLTVSIYTPEKKLLFYKDEFSKSKFIFNPKDESVTIKGNYFKRIGKNDSVELYLNNDKFSLSVTIDNLATGFKARDGVTYFDEEKEDYFEMYYHIPVAKVSGKLVEKRKEGDTTIEIKGFGYMDHNHTNLLTSDFSDLWYSFRGLSETYTIDVIEIILTEEYNHKRVPVLAVVKEGKVLFVTDNYSITPLNMKNDPSGYQYPTRFIMKGSCQGYEFELEYSATFMHEKYDILKHLGWATRQVVKLVAGKPIMYRFANQYTLTLKQGGTTEVIKGNGLHEVIVVKKPATWTGN